MFVAVKVGFEVDLLSDSVSLSVSNSVGYSALTVIQIMNSVPSSMTSYISSMVLLFFQHCSLPATNNFYFIAQFIIIC